MLSQRGFYPLETAFFNVRKKTETTDKSADDLNTHRVFLLSLFGPKPMVY